MKDFTKRAFLQMQGSWLKRSSLRWHADRSTCSDDARGPVHKTRDLPDGSMLLFGCTEQLDNKTMFLIGLPALHHLVEVLVHPLPGVFGAVATTAADLLVGAATGFAAVGVSASGLPARLASLLPRWLRTSAV